MKAKALRDSRAVNSPARVLPAIREQLEKGTLATQNLAEGLAIRQTELLRNTAPEALPYLTLEPGAKITAAMKACGLALHAKWGHRIPTQLQQHTSDTVRGWVCFALAAEQALAKAIPLLLPFADDMHFGVREWVWMALRPAIVAAPREAIALLQPLALSPSPRLRRFASEATRPRGVWCAHIALLREQPQLGLPLLTPLRADAEKYVQDSVANWLNDAAKDQADWVSKQMAQWRRESPGKATERIATRALRSLTVKA
jgi:3-methyladenine DNA glycosylase AlkC